MFNVLREALLLFGIGSQAVPAWDQENEVGNLNSGLNVVTRPTKSRHALASSFVPRRTPVHRRVELAVLPLSLRPRRRIRHRLWHHLWSSGTLSHRSTS